jgi:hypothetical protein
MQKSNTSSSCRAIAGCLVCVVLLIIARLGVDQLQNYRLGVAQLRAGDTIQSIMYFDRVLNAHIPFSPFEGHARKRLAGLASQFEEGEEYEQALLCYETLRSTMYLTRHFFLPFSGELKGINHKIALLKSKILEREGAIKNFQAGYDAQMEILHRDVSPSVMWSSLAVLSFFLYIGLVVLWIAQRRKVYAVMSLFSFMAWVSLLTCV